MSQIGQYKGIDYVRQPVNEVMLLKSKALAWFTKIDGEYTGDHFPTKGAMFAAIDSEPDDFDAFDDFE